MADNLRVFGNAYNNAVGVKMTDTNGNEVVFTVGGWTPDEVASATGMSGNIEFESDITTTRSRAFYGATALWVRVDNPEEEFPEWIQPVGSADAYMIGDKASHNGKHWISTADNNVWEPGVYGWDEVA